VNSPPEAAIGRRLPWPRGFALIASGLLVLLLLLSWPNIHGKHGPDMLGFTPYFAFGGALYFAAAGSRTGWLTVLASIPMMLWQFIESQMKIAPIQGIPVSIAGNLIILVTLLGAMSALAFVSIAKGRAIDRTLGDLTYPLYLYHEDVLVVILTITTGYAYSTLNRGFRAEFRHRSDHDGVDRSGGYALPRPGPRPSSASGSGQGRRRRRGQNRLAACNFGGA
jgi:peptidoglycan/LPS O-acetylase OafA/YrhL